MVCTSNTNFLITLSSEYVVAIKYSVKYIRYQIKNS